MHATMIIFSGLSFSYTALDQAIAWAQEHHTQLRVLFLPEKPVEEGYVFLSDIDAAEALAGEAEARQDDDQLLQGKIRLIKDKAEASGLPYTTEVSESPAISDILARTENVDKIYVDVGTGERKEAADRLFNPKELVEKAACPVELVTAE